MVFSKNKEFYSELLKLALPIALGSLVSFSISLSDNMIISKLGDEAVSVVFLGNQIAFLLTMLVSGIEATVLAVSSRLIGCGENDKARSIASLGVFFAIGISFVFFVFSCFFPRLVLSFITDNLALVESGAPFLRSLGVSFLFFAPAQALAAVLRSVKKAKIAFFAALSALGVNVFFNVVLIFGEMGFSPLGIFGAGIATVIARCVELVILFVYTFFIDCEMKLRPSSFFKIQKGALSLFLKNGIPLLATQIVWSINNFFATALMGRTPEGVVAGLSAATSLYNLSYVVTAGLSGALGIITGRLVGKGNRASLKKLGDYSKSAGVISLLLGLLTAVFMQAVKFPFISIWGLNSASSDWALGFINVLSFMVVGTAYQSALLSGFIKSTGHVGFIMKLESFFVFCLIIPLSLLASRLVVSPLSIFALLKCDQILKCPAAFFKLRKITRSYGENKSWRKPPFKLRFLTRE